MQTEEKRYMRRGETKSQQRGLVVLLSCEPISSMRRGSTDKKDQKNRRDRVEGHRRAVMRRKMTRIKEEGVWEYTFGQGLSANNIACTRAC